MTCRRLRPWLEEFATDGIDPAREAAFRAHLATCPACAAEWRAIEEVEPLLAAVLPVAVEEAALRRLHEAIGTRLDALPAPGRQPWRWPAFAGALACLVLGCGLGLRLLHTQPAVTSPTTGAGLVVAAAPDSAASEAAAPESTGQAAPAAPVARPAPAAPAAVSRPAPPRSVATGGRARTAPRPAAGRIAVATSARRSRSAARRYPPATSGRRAAPARPVRPTPAPPAAATPATDTVLVALALPVVAERSSLTFALRAADDGDEAVAVVRTRSRDDEGADAPELRVRAAVIEAEPIDVRTGADGMASR